MDYSGPFLFVGMLVDIFLTNVLSKKKVVFSFWLV